MSAPEFYRTRSLKLTPDQAQLYSEHEDWALGIALSFYRSKQIAEGRISSEQIKQSARIELCRLVQRFDSSKAAFRTFAYGRLTTSVVDVLRQEHIADRRVMPPEFVDATSDEVVSSRYSQSSDPAYAAELREALQEVVELIPPQFYEIFLMWWLSGMSQKAIANTIGKSHSRVCQIVNGCLEAIRKGKKEKVQGYERSRTVRRKHENSSSISKAAGYNTER